MGPAILDIMALDGFLNITSIVVIHHTGMESKSLTEYFSRRLYANIIDFVNRLWSEPFHQ